ncbi:RNA ligase family protein [Massilia sp. CF038]|uniref:RNA ligase family protein n=1 Tax=Massilia sp. CF038 TaxID=1881045 RepID=UPI0009150D1E|nr:RNA ligase family protein [Massilia sp. CF038]SHH20243.1 RNA ligase [Massilia sp. CF038]
MNINSITLLKYPRTAHLAGSRLQLNDSATDQIALSSLAGRYVVIEEKLDGANTGISFSDAAEVMLQSRGHYLAGGGSERQFNLLKPWARAHEAWLLERLDDRFVMYGEWTYAKHSVFYDNLPHFFHEFDIFDRQTRQFLSTKRRHTLLAEGPVLSVPVLYAGLMPTNPKHLWKLVYRSLAKTRDWKAAFEAAVRREGQPLDLSWRQTDKSDRSEGLYLKVEDDEQVLARYKLVRSDFTQTILDSGSHHARRPVLPNALAAGVDLYTPQLLVNWDCLGLKTLHTVDELAAASSAWFDAERM